MFFPRVSGRVHRSLSAGAMLLVLGGLFYPSHTQRMFVEVMTEADLGAALAALMIGAFVAMTTTLVMADIVVASAVVTAGVLAASGRVGYGGVFFRHHAGRPHRAIRVAGVAAELATADGGHAATGSPQEKAPAATLRRHGACTFVKTPSSRNAHSRRGRNLFYPVHDILGQKNILLYTGHVCKK